MSTRHSSAKASITPEGLSTFEYIVRHLQLSPEEYASSAVLKEWVRRHKDDKYVPPQLLDLWGFVVNTDDIAAGAKKPPKRAAKPDAFLFASSSRIAADGFHPGFALSFPPRRKETPWRHNPAHN